MKQTSIAGCIALCCLVVTCKQLPVDKDREGPAITVLRIADDDFPGWTQSPWESDFRVVEGDGIFDVINGGGQIYFDHNYVAMLYQVMDGPDGEQLNVQALKFPDITTAETIFMERTFADIRQFSDPGVELPGYDTTSVIGYFSLGAITIYARKDRFYLEVLVTGIAEEEQRIAAVKLFVDELLSRIDRALVR